MLKCGACGRFVSSSDGVSCRKCKFVYHPPCVGVLDKAVVPTTWGCTNCKAKMPCKNNDTPVKAMEQSSKRSPVIVELQKSPIVSAHNLTEEFNIHMEIRMFREEMAATRNELKEYRLEMTKLASSLVLCEKRISDLELKTASVEERTACKCQELADTVFQLEADLNNREQELLSNDVDIMGVPEMKGENPTQIVTLLATKIGINLQVNDIVRAERVGLSHGQSEGTKLARPLVVRLARRALKDDLLRAARVRRGADTADLNIPGSPRRFYINERLTKANRQLFSKAREAARIHKYKYTWTKDGRIYTRKSQKEASVRVKTEADLGRIFGADGIESNN